MIISKELLSEVLDEKLEMVVADIRYNPKKRRPAYSVYFSFEYDRPLKKITYGYHKENESRHAEYEINIHELAHKCKEWALDKGYSLYSGKIVGGWRIATEDNMLDGLISSDKLRYCDEFKADSEPEAIFKACEWIKEQL